MRNIYYIDVFTEKLGFGNPVAVILNADDLDTQTMQRIAAWTNLSETTFICAPKNGDADYELRIFTPKNELPFAGHPTIGSCFAAIESGLVEPKNNKIIQECKVGLVEINVGETIEFALPKAQFSEFTNEETQNLSGLLNQEIIGSPQIVNVGPKWIIAQLANAAKVHECKPDFAKMKIFEQAKGATGVTIFGKYEDSEDFIEVRSYAPSDGIDEDPVCGSGNGSVCAYMLENKLIAPNFSYKARQGRAINRDGQIFARIDQNSQIFIGGKCAIGVVGTLEI